MRFLRRQLWLLRLQLMGVLDREYFSVLAGRAFRSNRAALAYYLDHEDDRVRALSVNPLIEKDWIAAAHPDTDASWYAILWRSREPFATGPGFDARTVKPSGARATVRTRRALKSFLRTAMDSTPLPVVAESRGRTPTWGEFRISALHRAVEYVRQLGMREQRTAPLWNEVAERAVLSQLESVDSADVRSKSVTVILPTRNRVDSLTLAVESVRAQTFAGWRLIIVDDGSTDGTAAYVEGLGIADDRISVIRADGVGVGAARNLGLDAAVGDVVTFLDSDNIWQPEFLERSLRGMILRSSGFVYCAMRLLREDGHVYRGIQGSPDDLLYGGNFIDLNATMIERSLVTAAGGFDPDILRWSDYDLFLTLATQTAPQYLPFLGVDYDDHPAPDRITVSESASWEDVVVGKHLVDWTAMARSPRPVGSVSIIMPTHTDWRLTAAAARAVLDNSGSRPLELVILDNGSVRPVSAILGGLLGFDSRVRVIRAARNLNFALGNNFALTECTGEFVIALNNDTVVGPDWLEPLIGGIEADPRVIATQPLLLYADDTIQTAGTVFPGDNRLPRHFLQGRPSADASRVPSVDYSAITAAALCIRAVDLIALHGFDPIFTNGLEDVDLCLRALAAHPGSVFRVVSESVVVHLEGRTPGRSRAITRNREIFAARWNGKMPPSDLWRYEAMSLSEPED